MKITVADQNKNPIQADIDIKRWDSGKIVFSDRIRITKADQEITVPDADDVEITADSDGYVPKKTLDLPRG